MRKPEVIWLDEWEREGRYLRGRDRFEGNFVEVTNLWQTACESDAGDYHYLYIAPDDTRYILGVPGRGFIVSEA